MEHYEVFYRDTLIGRLTVDPQTNQYRYLPCPTGVAKVEKEACLLRVMTEGQPRFDEPIPFFQNRIYNMKRWNLTVVHYQTDNYTLRLLPEVGETNP